MARLNSKLEAEGAEFLVLGHLFIEGIVADKTYTRMPGYDLVAINPDRNSSARAQVKSRYATDFDGGFLIKRFECDFVVFVALNRGYRYARLGQDGGKKPPEFYLFPVETVKSALYEKSKWGKAFLRAIPEVDYFKNKWTIIREFLNSPPNDGLCQA